MELKYFKCRLLDPTGSFPITKNPATISALTHVLQSAAPSLCWPRSQVSVRGVLQTPGAELTLLSSPAAPPGHRVVARGLILLKCFPLCHSRATRSAKLGYRDLPSLHGAFPACSLLLLGRLRDVRAGGAPRRLFADNPWSQLSKALLIPQSFLPQFKTPVINVTCLVASRNDSSFFPSFLRAQKLRSAFLLSLFSRSDPRSTCSCQGWHN